MTDLKSDYKEYPKSLAPDDFWGQVRRTRYGKPVAEDQIQMIVEAIQTGLQFDPSDVLLDIACGNGALSRYFFSSCRAFLGVDYSEYLIEVAKKNFEQEPDYFFQFGDAESYVRAEPNPERFTKALCYGSFSFFPKDSARAFLQVLAERFTHLQRFYIGNLPDKERASAFYHAGTDYVEQLDDHASQIGIWRSRAEFEQLAAETGWRVVEFCQMPESFFASHYRFDLILERKC